MVKKKGGRRKESIREREAGTEGYHFNVSDRRREEPKGMKKIYTELNVPLTSMTEGWEKAGDGSNAR